MDQQKIGRFIAKSRKRKNMTQQELAEPLGVNNRTISRWENGNNMPDVSLFKPLCDILEITIDELLSGENINDKDIERISSKNLIDYSNYLKKKSRNKILFLIMLIIIILFSSISIIILSFNKTFLNTTYTSEFLDNVNILIPKFSYYRSTSGIDIYITKLKTLKQPDEVNIHIDRYLNTLDEINCNNEIYYYNQKNDFTILQYNINNDGIGFINTIYIKYHDGKYCINS